MQLKLAEFAEQFITVLALERRVGKVLAHDTLNLLHHFSLQLVLDLRHFDVERWNRIWPHNHLHSLITNQQLWNLLWWSSLLVWPSIFIRNFMFRILGILLVMS